MHLALIKYLILNNNIIYSQKKTKFFQLTSIPKIYIYILEWNFVKNGKSYGHKARKAFLCRNVPSEGYSKRQKCSKAKNMGHFAYVSPKY